MIKTTRTFLLILFACSVFANETTKLILPPPVYQSNTLAFYEQQSSQKKERTHIISRVAGLGFLIWGGYDLIQRIDYASDFSDRQNKLERMYKDADMEYKREKFPELFKIGFGVDIALITIGISGYWK